jgi:hypothetical protein
LEVFGDGFERRKYVRHRDETWRDENRLLGPTNIDEHCHEFERPGYGILKRRTFLLMPGGSESIFQQFTA